MNRPLRSPTGRCDIGFEIIGTLAKAFNHNEKELVDAHIMYRSLK